MYRCFSSVKNRKIGVSHEWAFPLKCSAKHMGALCVYCVLFSLKTAHGVKGSFTISSFKYGGSHTNSKWHKEVAETTRLFLENTSAVDQLDKAYKKVAAENIKVSGLILNSIIFCDLARKGMCLDERLFRDLFKLKIDSDDTSLESHLS
ncbi:unnamed protein product [Psylliodes chrysocephalus]|uniref:Uncharacterized protein n=1 Tax=Psylliodes chrysocephalus TaxID=3402493 RepID=A0A9P0G2S9_9CUCU|nr:unnamed protein product [Psylliodes chrysocephala]